MFSALLMSPPDSAMRLSIPSGCMLTLHRTPIPHTIQFIYMILCVKQYTYPSSLTTCCSRSSICFGSSGPNLKRVQRDWRAGMILER